MRLPQRNSPFYLSVVLKASLTNASLLCTTISYIFSIIGKIVMPLKLSTWSRLPFLNTAERRPEAQMDGKSRASII